VPPPCGRKKHRVKADANFLHGIGGRAVGEAASQVGSGEPSTRISFTCEESRRMLQAPGRPQIEG